VREGIERQLTRCRSLAASRGFTLLGEYVDNDTSAKKARGAGTDWARMLGEVRPGDVIVAVDVDRLLRSQRDLLALIDSGALIVTVDGEIDLASADGEFRATMLAALARFEIRRKAERQDRANAARVEKGLPVPGKRRFGFENGNMVERRVEAEKVRWAFDAIAAGDTISGVAKELDKPAIRVREILSNPSYAGWVVRRGERFEAAPEVARVVDRALWEDVQVILSDPSRKTSPGPARKHLASGLARCGVCQRPLISMTEYACPDPARHVYIRRNELDTHLTARVWSALLGLAEEPAESVDTAQARLLRAERAELQGQRTRAQRIAMLEDADLLSLQRELKKISARLTEIEEQLGDLALQGRSRSLVETAQEVKRIVLAHGARDAASAMRAWLALWGKRTLEERRALVADLLDAEVNSARSGLPRIVITTKRSQGAN
jgi:DNA invertase Pin-like site-specific DNA recombinase